MLTNFISFVGLKPKFYSHLFHHKRMGCHQRGHFVSLHFHFLAQEVAKGMDGRELLRYYVLNFVLNGA